MKFIYKKSYFLILFIFFSHSAKTETNYIVEVHGTIQEVKTHQYTNTDSLKFLTINGTFKDNLGNFGQTNSLVFMLTKNNIVEKLESHNEFLYDNNIKAFNIATRSSDDFKSGVGKWKYTYVSNEIKDLRNASCVYSVSYFKASFLAISKCKIPEIAYKQLQSIRNN